MGIQFEETFPEAVDALKDEEAANIDVAGLYESYSSAVRRGKLFAALTTISGGLVMIANTGILKNAGNPLLEGAILIVGAIGSFVGGIGLFTEGYEIRFAKEALQEIAGVNPYDIDS